MNLHPERLGPGLALPLLLGVSTIAVSARVEEASAPQPVAAEVVVDVAPEAVAPEAIAPEAVTPVLSSARREIGPLGTDTVSLDESSSSATVDEVVPKAATVDAAKVVAARASTWKAPEPVWNRAREARLLSRRGLWVSASSQWRAVLHDLQMSERTAHRGSALNGLSLRERALREEAEREMRRAQSQLWAFWNVRDLVTLGADSRNPEPALERAPDRPGQAPTLVAQAPAQAPAPVQVLGRVGKEKEKEVAAPMAAPRTPRLASRGQAGRTAVVRSSAVFRISKGAPELTHVAPSSAARISLSERVSLGSAQQARPSASRHTRAALAWARSQWWARPLVQRAVDSRNTAPQPLPAKPTLTRVAFSPAPVLASEPVQINALAAVRPSSSLEPHASVAGQNTLAASSKVASSKVADTIVAAISAPKVAAAAPALKPRPVARRSWTMQLRLPAAAEAASAAERALGS